MYKVLAFLTLMSIGIYFFIQGSTCACSEGPTDAAAEAKQDEQQKINKTKSKALKNPDAKSFYDSLLD